MNIQAGSVISFSVDVSDPTGHQHVATVITCTSHSSGAPTARLFYELITFEDELLWLYADEITVIK
jgi:hypothetical protein